MANARWRVTNDEPREDLGNDGRFRSVRHITFELLDSGRVGHVTVDLRNYTADNVAAAIQPYADQLEAVGNLTTG